MLISIILTAIIILLDQLTKWLAVTFLKSVDTIPLLEGILHLTYVENRGAAFGILADNRWVFIIISTIAIIGLSIFLFKFAPKNCWLKIGIIFILGGGIGNMIDRIFLGYVIDFIDFRLINFAVFNTADSFVCIGAVLLLIYIFFFSDKEEKKGKINDGN